MNLSTPRDWKGSEKLLFRILFIYFFIQAVPLDWKYYKTVFSINWLHLSFGDIFYLSRYTPRILPTDGAFNSIGDWLIIALIALVGAAIWSYLDRQRATYNQLYYWLRVIVRYRLAIGIIAYGLLKVFPQQMPYPSISNLNTHYGDMTAWKLFSISTGVVPPMESFLGVVETIAGLLLLNRRTAAIGAGIIITFTGNVFMSNLAYEGGEGIYSFYLLSFAAFILAYDIQRIGSLLALQQPTAPNRIQPYLPEKWQQQAKLALKTVFIFFFVVLYGVKTYAGYREGSYQFPTTKGLPKAAGIYNVREFKLRGEEHPYSLTDSLRWQDVVFEHWGTLSVRSLAYVQPDLTNTEEIYSNEHERNYELEGSISRQYYEYTIDSARHTLYLQNKNPHYKTDQLILHYERLDSATIVLSNDSLYVVLDRLNKKYPLIEGRRKPLNL
jgi:hypothetical protein